MKFKHLNVPDHWEHYWSRYPEGYTILEALISWVSQVDSMVDNQNKLTDNVEQFRNEIDDFVGRFDDRLQEEVTQTLSDWQESGFIDVVISEALQWELDNFIATTEQNFLSVNQQLQQMALKNPDTISIKSFGVKGDGTDETDKIQTALNSCVGKTLYWDRQEGDYYVTRPLFIPSNITIIFQPNTHVKSSEGYTLNQSLFTIKEEKNVHIIGNYATVQMNKHEYTTGEHRHVFFVLGSDNVYIEKLIVKDSGGDGFLLGGIQEYHPYKPSENITVTDCVIDNHRRQGISVVGNISNVKLLNNIIKNTIGTDPQSGIDIEPNNTTYDNNDILISGNTIINNVRGILVYNNSYNIRIENNDIINSWGVQVSSSLTLNPTVYINNNNIEGSHPYGIYMINGTSSYITSNTIKNALNHGIFIQGVDKKATNNIIRNNSVYNCTGNGITLENCDDSNVFGNSVENVDKMGVSLRGQSNNNIVNQNKIKNSAKVTGNYLLDISNSSNNIITNNTLRKGVSSNLIGVHVQGGSSHTIIKDNDFMDSGANNDILINNPDTITINNIRNNGEYLSHRSQFLPSPNKYWLGKIVLKTEGTEDIPHICLYDDDVISWKPLISSI